jgi:protein-disulfide isomerase
MTAARSRTVGWGVLALALLLLFLEGSLALGSYLAAQVGTPLAQSTTALGQYAYGEPKAPVVVTEYADFQCPGCAEFAALDRSAFLRSELRSGKVRFVFADYPLPFHTHAEDAAVAARCAGEAGKFWAYHDALFERQDRWAHSKYAHAQFLMMASKLHIPLGPFTRCLDSAAPRAFVRASVARGNALKMPGTPSFTVNGKPVPWQEDQDQLVLVERAVQAALEKK